MRGPTTHRMQFGVGEDESSLVMGADEVVDTPTYDNLNTNIREESIQRILSRLSPNGQRAFLRTLSEGESDVRPPLPFVVPETDSEDECSELGEPTAKRSEIDYLLDSPIPELTTKSLIPPPGGESIQSRPLMTMHPNATVRGNKPGTTKVYTEFREVNRHFREELPVDLHVGSMSMGKPLGDIQPSQQFIRPEPFLPSDAERVLIQSNPLPATHVSKGDQNASSLRYPTVYETKVRNSPTRTTGTTQVVWSNKGLLPVINETGPSQTISSPGTTNPSKTYPKLLAGVEMFHSARSPLGVDPEILYAERTGVDHPVTSSDRTTKYPYFSPIEAEVHREHDTIRTRWETLQAGHGTVPDQGYVDPLMGGGNYRHKIAHQPVPQFFSGSGGAMPENYGYRFTRPTPNELDRGNPLEGIRPPRPPHYLGLYLSVSLLVVS